MRSLDLPVQSRSRIGMPCGLVVPRGPNCDGQGYWVRLPGIDVCGSRIRTLHRQYVSCSVWAQWTVTGTGRFGALPQLDSGDHASAVPHQPLHYLNNPWFPFCRFYNDVRRGVRFINVSRRRWRKAPALVTDPGEC